LKNKNIARKIIEAANVNKDDTVLEIGPGKGALTEILLQKAKKVIAVEKDKELADFLMDKFSAKGAAPDIAFGEVKGGRGPASGGKGQNNLSVINDDILKFKIKNLNYKIVANIPYYITSHFLRKFLESDFQPILMALMLQKEVAERIVARDGKESILSISVKSYGQPRIIAKISAKNFSPEPKVDSAIILIENISKDFFNPPAGGNKINEKRFFQIVKLGFGHKRKILKNNLKISAKILQKCKIPALSRAEELDLNDWKCLAKTRSVLVR